MGKWHLLKDKSQSNVAQDSLMYVKCMSNDICLLCVAYSLSWLLLEANLESWATARFFYDYQAFAT